jgi:cyclopropane fatty-acyl-phospholipid synthase-like methyltransferase
MTMKNGNLKHSEYVFTKEYFETCNMPHWFKNSSAKFRQRRRDLLRLVESDPQKTLLEFGCSRGDTTLFLAPRFKSVTGIDYAEAAIEICRQRLEKMQFDNVDFIVGDVSFCPKVKDKSFDRILAADLVEHVPDDVMIGIYRESERILKPGGTLSIYTPCLSHYVERAKKIGFIPQIIDHIAVRTAEQLMYLLSKSCAGLKLDLLYYSPSCYPFFGLVDRMFLWIGPLARFFRHKICIRLRKNIL